MELIGLFFIASGLLVLAGIAKSVRPDDTARALVLLVSDRTLPSLSFYFARHFVRIGSFVEAALGVLAVLFPRPVTAALVAISYSLFVCTLLYARRHESPLSTCGCFGRPDTPATGLHVVLNVVFVATTVAVALRPPHLATLASLLKNQPWDGGPLLLASGLGVWLSYLALSPLATLAAARRPPQQRALNT
jgi:hypothetical protein